ILKLWDATRDGPPHFAVNCGREWTPAIAFGPGMRWLASGSGDGQLNIWDMDSGEASSIICPAGIASLSVNHEGSRIAVAYDGRHGVAFWDPATRKPLGEIAVKSSVNAIVFSPDGKRLLTVGENGLATIWDVETHKAVKEFTSHKEEVSAGAFSSSGKLVATA